MDFTTEEGAMRLKVREKEVFNKMLEDQTMALLARERGIRVTDEMVHDGLTRRLEEYGNREEVRTNLERLYGWTLDDFEEKIVRPGLYEEKMIAFFESDVDTRTEAEAKIQEAALALQNKTSFSDVARKFSEGETATEGGELGWFTLPDLAPELASSVSVGKIGVPGEIVESSLGFHIVLIEEKKTEGEQELFRLSQIFTKKALFSDWLLERMKEQHIMIWSPEYRFDPETARIEFKETRMREFEERLIRENGGDASFFF